MVISPPPRRRQGVREEFSGSVLPAGWAKTDTENKITFSNGLLVCAGGRATPIYDDPRMTWTKPFVVKAGLTYEQEFTFTAWPSFSLEFGFDASNPVAQAMRPGFVISASNLLVNTAAATITIPFITNALNVSYRYRIVLTNPGAVWLVSLDAGRTWIPVWQESTGFTGSYSMGWLSKNVAFTSQYAKVFQGVVPQPVLSDTFAARTAPGRADTGHVWLAQGGAVAVPVIAGDARIQAGQSVAWMFARDGVADGIWECDVNFGSAPNTAKQVFLIVRWFNATNYVRVYLNRTLNLMVIGGQLGGVSTTFVSSGALAPPLADNTTYKVRLVAVGPVLKAYLDGVEKASTSNPFAQFSGLCSLYLNDDLPTPDIRVDNFRVWGNSTRPLLADSFDRPDTTNDLAPADSGQAYNRTGDLTPFTSRWGISNGRSYCFARSPSAQAQQWAPLREASFVCGAVLRWNGTMTGNPGFMLRQQDENDWIAVRLETANLRLTQMLNGAITTLNAPAFTAVADRDYVVVAVVLGNLVDVYVDGVRVIAGIAMANFPNSPSGGTYANSSGNTGQMDDLRYFPLGNGALVHDTFSRADSATTVGATELPGVAWTVLFGGTWGISGSQAYNLDTTSTRAIVVPVLAPDVDVQADLVRQTGTVGLLLRVGGSGGDYLAARFDGTTCNVIERVASGSIPTLASVPYTWTAGATARTVRVRVFQSMLSIYVNEVLILAVPFAGHAGAAENQYGLYVAQTATTNRFDNFSVKEVVDTSPGPVPVRDTFGRADSATTLGVTETPGSPWVVGNAGDLATLPTFGITSAKAYMANAGSQADPHAWVETGRSDFVRVACDLTIPAGAISAGLLFRRVDASNYYVLRATESLDNIALFRNLGGVRASQKSASIPLAGGQVVRIEVVLWGALIAVYANGALLFTHTDPNFLGGTKHGLVLSTTSPTTAWDSFLVEPLTELPAGLVAPTALVKDTFTRPDSALVMGSTEWPNVVPWEPQNGAVFGVSGGRAYAVVLDAGNRDYALVQAGFADGFVQADMGNSGGNAGIVFRAEADWSNMLEWGVSNSTTLLLREWSGGVSATLASYTFPLVSGTIYPLRAEFVGNQIRCYLNGVLVVASATDRRLTGTRHGIRGAISPIVRHDQFLAQSPALALAAPPAIADTFNRADNATTLGFTDTGSLGWVVNGTWGIDTNRAYCVNDVQGSFALIYHPHLNFAVEVVLNGPLASDVDYRYGLPAIHYDGVGTSFYAVIGAGMIRLVKRDGAGTITDLATAAVPTPDATDILARIELSGKTITVLTDGIPRCAATLSDADYALIPSLRRSGFRLNKGGSPVLPLRFDAFQITPTLLVPNPGSIAADTFTRADTAAGLGATEVGSLPWVETALGGGFCQFGITSGKAFLQTAGGTYNTALVQAGVSDVDLSVDVIWGAGGGSSRGLVLRGLDADNCINVRILETSDVVEVRRTTAGIGSLLASYPTPVAVNTTYRLRVVAKGPTILTYLNGVFLGRVDIPVVAGATRHGLFAQLAGPNPLFPWDNFSISAAT